MQRVKYFIKASLLIELSNKLSAEANSENVEEGNRKIFLDLSKAIHDLSHRIMGKCFGKGEYAKSSIEDSILLHKSKFVVAGNPSQLNQSIISTLEKVFEMFEDEKLGLKNIKKVFLDSGAVNEFEAKIFKDIKSLTNKIEKTILSLQ